MSTYETTYLYGPVFLKVNIAGYPPVQTDEIRWFHPRGHLIINGSILGFSLLDDGKTLYIDSAVEDDAGTYHITVVRQGSTVDTDIDLIVIRK